MDINGNKQVYPWDIYLAQPNQHGLATRNGNASNAALNSHSLRVLPHILDLRAQALVRPLAAAVRYRIRRRTGARR